MTTQAQAPASDKRPTALDTYAEFVAEVERLCRRDPGNHAALRAGLRRDLDHPRVRPMHRLLTTLVPAGCDDTAQAYYTVASLIAARPRHSFTAAQEADEHEEAIRADQETQAAQKSERTAGKADRSAPTRSESFGAALGQAVVAKGSSMRLSAAESRINLLTRQSLRGIHLHLPAAVNQVRVTETPIHWDRLLADLVDWPHRSGRISRHWLQDFYRITASVARD
ncbi:type I-E CRISPR-associated protein Cse2/CasB [Streptomyces spiramenti]|uniref:Type I-E CRISPR-associated protein Cse2/CasB n=1 Tax=Streptomyces spiramenti TaxID=2720606 RepID=A0ABX1AMN7_9ACTN|nr:type I-E CRISPR-associated protein Cse2/CasB [Streptomyces spiramenti]